MPVIFGLIGLVTIAFIWIMRMRNAAEMTQEIAGVAQDVLAAARRLGFQRKMNLHPVDSIDDPRIATGALAIAFLELGGLPTSEQQDRLLTSLQVHTGQKLTEAEETLILGRWLVVEAHGPQAAVPRLARRLAKLDGASALDPLMGILTDISAAGRDGRVSARQQEALAEIARIFKVN